MLLATPTLRLGRVASRFGHTESLTDRCETVLAKAFARQNQHTLFSLQNPNAG